MRRSPRNVTIAFSHAGLTHYGGVLFFNEFVRMLQLRRFLTRHLSYPRRNGDYSVAQMLLALVYPIVLGLDRIETASLLRSDGTFQYLTGLPSFPDPQTLRRFLLNAPAQLHEQLHRANDRLLQRFIHLPEHRSRLILDLDSTVVTSTVTKKVLRLATIRAIEASDPMTHYSAWKRTLHSFGMWSCGAAMRVLGQAARNC